MLNFRDFSKQNQQKDFNESDLKKAKSVIDKYSKMDEEQLSQKLQEAILQGKKNNTFDKQKILSQINALSGILTKEQQEKIVDLLNRFDN